uniref:Putative secreted protein n=1 Tax=Ixodes ricinus TaxID=34613 RepID=A0A6B0UG36_IXORI
MAPTRHFLVSLQAVTRGSGTVECPRTQLRDPTSRDAWQLYCRPPTICFLGLRSTPFLNVALGGKWDLFCPTEVTSRLLIKCAIASETRFAPGKVTLSVLCQVTA